MRSRMLAYGAIGAWAAGGAASVAMLVMHDHERIEGGCLLLLAAAIALTYLWRTADRGKGSRVDDGVGYQVGYLTGRADERREQEDARRIRSVQIDGINATIVGGPNQSIDDETINIIRATRAQFGGRR